MIKCYVGLSESGEASSSANIARTAEQILGQLLTIQTTFDANAPEKLQQYLQKSYHCVSLQNGVVLDVPINVTRLKSSLDWRGKKLNLCRSFSWTK